MVSKATKKKPVKSTRQGGRPLGSKSKPKPSVSVHPPRCPSCKGTNCKVQPGYAPIVRDVSGVLPGGERFTSVIWRSKVCQDCGQHFREKSYLFDPALWK